MTTQTRTSLGSHSRAGRSTTQASVTSRDGTSIGYRQVGHGPGLIVVHGMGESGQSHLELAQALADKRAEEEGAAIAEPAADEAAIDATDDATEEAVAEPTDS